MDTQQEKVSRAPDRPSFFGLPTGWQLWSQVGPRFWGGVLVGFGIGLLMAAVLLELELHRSVWVGVLGIVLAGVGQIVALRAVRRSRQPENR